MDLAMIAKVLERAVASLELDAPVYPWWLGEEKPRRAVLLERVLAAPCPSPNDVDQERILAAFLAEDREDIARQIDEGYTHLVLRSEEHQDLMPLDEASVVYVRLGVPLIGRDRVLLRICTRNVFGDAQTVTGDYHAWLDLDGTQLSALDQNQEGLESPDPTKWGNPWPRWIVGRSPGLEALN